MHYLHNYNTNKNIQQTWTVSSQGGGGQALSVEPHLT